MTKYFGTKTTGTISQVCLQAVQPLVYKEALLSMGVYATP